MFHNLIFVSNTLLNVTRRRFFSIMAKKAAVFLAPGAEEMEFVISVDVLRRAGIEVTVVGIPDKNTIKCSRGVFINPDVSLSEVSTPYDALVLPGGLDGSKHLANSTDVGKLLKEQEVSGRLIAAICAAPTALKAHGIGKGKQLTSYPSVKGDLMSGDEGYVYKEEDVVVDNGLITSRGPGTAYKFALAITENLVGCEIAKNVAGGMLLTY